MNWWIPIEINLSEGAWTLIGVLLGAAITYITDIRRSKKADKQRRLERVMAIHSEFEGLAMRLLGVARYAHTMNFSLMQSGRKKVLYVNQRRDSGPAWDKLVEDTKQVAMIFIGETQKYQDLLGAMHTHMIEFEHYLQKGKELDNSCLRNYKLDRFDFSKLPDDEFQKLDLEKASMDIHEKFRKELIDCIHPTIKIMKDRINELKHLL